MHSASISVVIPVYNEEQVLFEIYKRLKAVLDSMQIQFEIIFVNDGSLDSTSQILGSISAVDNTVTIIDFTRNFGHQTAISAGLDYSSGDAVIVIDADLQDPPEVIPMMVSKWREGYDVVYGKRTSRNGETLFKRVSASIFYRILNSLSDSNIPLDTGDFRLIDRKVCNALKLIKERNRYVRGIISWLGFKEICVEYVRDRRFAGKTKYSFRNMLHFAFDGITSFSVKPLKLSSYVGGVVSCTGFCYLLVVIYLKLFTSQTVTGWASMMAVSLFFNGIVLLMLGIIGEYIGRIYDEVKGRPLYIIRETHNSKLKVFTE